MPNNSSIPSKSMEERVPWFSSDMAGIISAMPLPNLQTASLWGRPLTASVVCAEFPVLCRRFDVGPILQQELYEVPPNCTADELGQKLAVMGARMVRTSLNHAAAARQGVYISVHRSKDI